ncbi:hypothetical protein [Pseudoalteromonas sp. SaAl2]
MHTNIIDAMSDVAEVFKNEGLETRVDVDQTHCALVVGHGRSQRGQILTSEAKGVKS